MQIIETPLPMITANNAGASADSTASMLEKNPHGQNRKARRAAAKDKRIAEKRAKKSIRKLTA